MELRLIIGARAFHLLIGDAVYQTGENTCMILHVMTYHVKGIISGTKEGTHFWKILIRGHSGVAEMSRPGIRYANVALDHAGQFFSHNNNNDVFRRHLTSTHAGLARICKFFQSQISAHLITKKTFSHHYNLVTFSLQIGSCFARLLFPISH